MIEIINQDAEFENIFLQAIHTLEPTITKSGHVLLSIFDAEYVTEVDSTAGHFNMTIDNYDFCFINGGIDCLQKIDSLLKSNSGFKREHVNIEEYNTKEHKKLLKNSIDII
jgi:hypothetical protein